MDDKWLNQQFRNFPGKTKGDLSEFLGIQASGISKMLSGTRQIKAKEYLLMRKFFDMPGGAKTSAKKISATPSYSDMQLQEEGRQDWEASESGNYKIIKMSDAAMVPDFLPGERLLVDASLTRIDKSGIFALEEKNDILVRIIEMAGDKLKISSISRDAAPRLVQPSKIKIIGRVIAKLNWL